MTIIEATVLVPHDRRLVLQVPDDVLPGQHRVRIQIDPVANSSSMERDTREIEQGQTTSAEHRLRTFAEDWDRPEADVFNEP